MAYPGERVIEILDLLNKLSHARNTELLCSVYYSNNAIATRDERIIEIHNYIVQNFRSQIKLKTLAELAHMTPHAFCNYFKNKNRKPVFTYINDLRIGFICKC
jgi:AraC-like DNA-binding protein